MRLPLLVVVLVLGLSHAGHAQAVDSAYARAGLEALSRRLAADPSLPDSLRRLTPTDLHDKRLMDPVPGLSDSAVVQLMGLLAQSLHQLPEPICGAYLTSTPAPGPEPAGMLPWLPHPLVDRWLGWLETLVRARLQPQPVRQVATAEEVRAWNVAHIGRLPASDRDRVVRISQNPPPSPADACWLMRVLMDGYATAPAATIAPIVRVMFGHAP